MALLEVQADLSRTAKALEHIAESLEWLVLSQMRPHYARTQYAAGAKPGRPKFEKPSEPTSPEQVTFLTDEQMWEAEMDERELRGEPAEEET